MGLYFLGMGVGTGDGYLCPVGSCIGLIFTGFVVEAWDNLTMLI